MSFLLTGGLGYIGSHVAQKLGSKAIIIDNSCNSILDYKKHLPHSTVYKKELNFANLEKIFLKHKISSVIHLAGFKSVKESVENPLSYYKNNIIPTIQLLEAMHKYKINKLIFSSSATVYGNDQTSPLTEEMPLKSVNPYGSTKIIIEQLISDFSKQNLNFKAISLRYFNPIGANYKSNLFDQPLGQPQNLMPILIDTIKKKKKFRIYGNDYDTPDGTCIRDYIHIDDLAEAHIKALKKVSKIKGHIPINIGLGQGLSVLEFIKLFEKVNKINIKYFYTKRRLGDAAKSFADNTKAKTLLRWLPRKNYSDMMLDSWNAK